jgi:ArsR family transcriptional regulator
LYALADRTRVLIVSAVLHAPERRAQLDLRQPTSGHHLHKLVRSGIVEREQRGPYAYFRVAPDALSRLRAIFGGRPPRVRGGDGAHPGRWRGRHNEPGGNPGGRAAEHDVPLKCRRLLRLANGRTMGIRPSARVSS